jgi:transcriptional regulator with AAA-type ATPase domain/NAD-dependent dihydropyrimidine dehydrogenase PreA subunit
MVVTETADFLKCLPSFAHLSDETVGRIAEKTRLIRFAPGDTLLEAGRPGTRLFILREGNAEVRQRQEANDVLLTVLNPGEYFGEMSLISSEPVSADVVARDACEVYVIEGEDFRSLLREHPDMTAQFVGVMSKRLTRTNVRLSQTHRQITTLRHLLCRTLPEDTLTFIGASPHAAKVRAFIAQEAAADHPLLIRGEPGTGKKLLAGLLHSAGRGANRPFLVVNLAHHPLEHMEEVVLGSGDGAEPSGLLAMAEGGTVVVERLELLPREAHRRLAGLLSGPAGASTGKRPRFIFLADEITMNMIESRTMDPELATLLLAHAITLAPLRERKRDIPALAEAFAARHARQLGTGRKGIASTALSDLVSYDYRAGNVKELEAAIRRAVVLSESDTIGPEHIFLRVPSAAAGRGPDLLKAGPVAKAVASGMIPRGLQLITVLSSAAVVGLCLSPAGSALQTAGLSLAWGVWWPLVCFSFLVAGRLWCAVCPISAVAAAGRRIVRLNRPVPPILRKLDFAIPTVGFLMLVWLEHTTNMHGSGRATVALLVTLTLLAAMAAMIFPREIWCRYLCALGAFMRVSAVVSPVGLRTDPDVCLSRCTDHACYKGRDGTEGCPLFQHALFVDNSEMCKLCLQCYRTCPNHSVRVRLNVPAQEIWTSTRCSGPSCLDTG